MIGAAWSIDTLDDGWDDDSDVDSTWVFGSSASYDSFYTDVGELAVCSLAIPAYWAENHGGITLDLMVRAETGPTWEIHPTYFTCEDLAGTTNQCGIGVIAMIANGIIDDFTPAEMNSHCIPPVTGSWQEIDSTSFHPTSGFQYYSFLSYTGTNLYAHDPIPPPMEDGTYRRDNDIIELYFYITPPTASSATGAQYVIFWVKAKISD